MNIPQTLDEFLSLYYQSTIMGRPIGAPVESLIHDYIALSSQDPEYMIQANLRLNSLAGIDSERCVISKNQREFLQKIVAAKEIVK